MNARELKARVDAVIAFAHSMLDDVGGDLDVTLSLHWAPPAAADAMHDLDAESRVLEREPTWDVCGSQYEALILRLGDGSDYLNVYVDIPSVAPPRLRVLP